MLDAVLEVLEGSVEVDTLLRLEAGVAMFSSERQATTFVRGATSRNVSFARSGSPPAVTIVDVGGVDINLIVSLKALLSHRACSLTERSYKCIPEIASGLCLVRVFLNDSKWTDYCKRL